MRATVHAGEVSAAACVKHETRLAARQPPFAQMPGQLGLTRTFIQSALHNQLLIVPAVHRNLAHWRGRSAEIPSPRLRRCAEEAHAKRGNIEGAALFAILAPAAQCRHAVRALVAFQTAYNYLDVLSELPGDDAVRNSDQLHQALLGALGVRGEQPDYYEYSADRDDGGYLQAIVAECREALGELPSWQAFAPTARVAAARIVDFQSLNLSEAQGGHGAMRAWASEIGPAANELAWWETAAASGSSLAVHALSAAAADPRLDAHDARDIDRVYFPWMGALHSLLDSLVDRREDFEGGRGCLLDYYASSREAARRLARFALHTAEAAEGRPQADSHRVILTAMCSYYLSAPQCRTVEGQTIEAALTGALGRKLRVATALFTAKRFLHSLTGHGFA
jgi:tetraprenyl-beta-curcumene synthase